MPSLDKQSLIASLCPPLDKILTEQLIDEFVSLEKRFVLRDWEPATLDGGQFTEAGARIIYHQDSGNLNRTKSVHKCLEYIEDIKNKNVHLFLDRKPALHSAKALRTIYKFRSARGAIHIDPTYSANQIDSKLVLEVARWVLSEIMRVFWKGQRAQVASIIRQLAQYDIPVIGDYEGRLYVHRTDCSTEEEILIILHHVGEEGLSRTDLGRFVNKDSSAISRALQKLCSNQRREIIKMNNGNFRLTDIGIRLVLTKLAEKLTV